MSNSIFSSTFNSSSPYRNSITEVLQLLENAEIITSENKQQTIDIANNYLEDNSDFINITWCADDVLEAATQRGLNLSQEQCLEILEYLESNHDANAGISWETIECAFDSLGFN